jgi:CheY-like chemotaxis protein
MNAIQPSRLPKSREAADAARAFTILVIDDDDGTRAIVRRVLVEEGYVVLEAADGEAGLRLIEHHKGPLDLVLTDIDMPHVDGITVAEVLSAFRPLLGVIGMSGGLNATIFQKNLGLWPQPFLAKPFTPQELALKIGETLARSQEILAAAETRQMVMRDYLAEARLAAAADLVAAAHRLRARALRSPNPSRARQFANLSAFVDCRGGKEGTSGVETKTVA